MLKLKSLYIFIIIILIFSIYLSAQVLSSEILPAPGFNGKNTHIFKLLEKRRTHRQFSKKEIPSRVLSELLWSANGVNDSASGKRTVPSAYNWHGISVYAATKKGLYLYMPANHSLIKISDNDLREFTGSQDFVKDAPLTLIFVADLSKMSPKSNSMTDDKRIFLSAIEAGCACQNVYLYCASEGLNSVIRDLVDRETLAIHMEILKPDQRIVITQTVGYPE